MLTLLIGTDWTANRDAVLQMIAEDVQARKGGRILIVPELISHDMERRLCEAAGDTASRFAQVLTFTRMARRVSDTLGLSPFECLDNGGRMVAMAATVRHLHSKLKAYGSVGTRPEFLTGLVDGALAATKSAYSLSVILNTFFVTPLSNKKTSPRKLLPERRFLYPKNAVFGILVRNYSCQS